MKYIDEFFRQYFLLMLFLFIALPYSVICAVIANNYAYITLFILISLLSIIHYIIFRQDEDL